MKDFPIAKLGRVARPISGVGFPHEQQGLQTGDVPFLKVSDLSSDRNRAGIIGSANWVSKRQAKQLGARLAPPGSIVFPKVGAALLKNTRNMLLVLAAMDNNLMAVVPGEGYPRFWYYVLAAADLGELAGSAPVPYVSESQVRDMRIPFPGVEEQRRIADFLDAETSRIDRLVALRRTLSTRLEERCRAHTEQALDGLAKRFGTVAFGRVVRGIEQGSSPECEATPATSEEWGVLKLSAVKRGRFHASANKRIPDGMIPNLRNRVHNGDLLITRANTPELVGDSAVALVDTATKILLPDLIYRVRVTSDYEAAFASLVVNGRRVRGLIEATARGTSQSMVKLRGDDIKQWPVCAAPLSVQREFVRTASEARVLVDRLVSAIRRQVELLHERRRALITAAVTGQLDVTTARSGVRV